jgi:mono/diheme cytochrome c family protein
MLHCYCLHCHTTVYSLQILSVEVWVMKVLKWIGIVLGSLIGIVLLVVVGLYAKARIEFSHKYAVQVEAVSVPTDAASIERGKHLAAFLCQECHGNDLGGNPRFFAADGIGSATAPNLTAGAGGLGGQFSDADFVRAIQGGPPPRVTAEDGLEAVRIAVAVLESARTRRPVHLAASPATMGRAR